jgi:hypothetical protein
MRKRSDDKKQGDQDGHIAPGTGPAVSVVGRKVPAVLRAVAGNTVRLFFDQYERAREGSMTAWCWYALREYIFR